MPEEVEYVTILKEAEKNLDVSKPDMNISVS